MYFTQNSALADCVPHYRNARWHKGFCVCRVKQLEEENNEMSLNMNRLKSQTEKLDEVSVAYISGCISCVGHLTF